MNKRRVYIGGGILLFTLLIIGIVLTKTIKVVPLIGKINPRAYGLLCGKITGQCNGLVEVNCKAEVDGPLYYVNVKTGAIVATCGGACDRAGGCRPGTCPPPAWTCSVSDGVNVNTDTNQDLANINKPVVNDQTTEAQCVAQGGKWGRWGKLIQENQCNPATSDAGKVCSNGSECQGACIATLTKDQEQNVISGQALTITGTCSRLKYNFGCHALVEQGRVDGILCAD